MEGHISIFRLYVPLGFTLEHLISLRIRAVSFHQKGPPFIISKPILSTHPTPPRKPPWSQCGPFFSPSDMIWTVFGTATFNSLS